MSRDELTRAVWEREMRRLQLGARALTAVLVALLARVILVGITPAIEVTGAVVAALLVACLLLTRQGRGLEPRSPTERTLR